MRHINKLEFYITNVCNLTCEQCNRYNNHDFRGWQRWSDYRSDYIEWSRRITVDGIVILGGEPLLNPTINDWVRGLNTAFNNSVQILSNGTRLNAVPGLYDALNSFKPGQYFTERNWIGITAHHANDVGAHIDAIHQFLKGPVKDVSATDCFGAQFAFCDTNQIVARLWLADSFVTSNLRPTLAKIINQQIVPANKWSLYNNDPAVAHADCGFANWKNYHMIRGQLYKCGPVALMPEFDQQFSLVLSDEDRKLLNSYRPLSPWDSDQTHNEFFATLDNPIAQCKFCPVKSQRKSISIKPTTKKSGSTSVFD
jgi:organic radical activating enzyme